MLHPDDCGIIKFCCGSVFVKFVGTSRLQNNILHQLIDYGYKVIFLFVGVREYPNLLPHELVKLKQSTKIGSQEI